MRIAVTGAFGYSGRYIAHRLLDAGHTVITLTNSLKRDNPFGGQMQAFPFNFDKPERLTESLRGIDALINTVSVLATPSSRLGVRHGMLMGCRPSPFAND